MRKRAWPIAVVLALVAISYIAYRHTVTVFRTEQGHLIHAISVAQKAQASEFDAESAPYVWFDMRPPLGLVQFWDRLLTTMMDTAPGEEPVMVAGSPTDEEMDPNLEGSEGEVRVDRVIMSSEQQDAMHDSHRRFVDAARQLAPDMPFQKGSRGIVMTAGGQYVGMLILSLVMLRRTGSALPVQVFLDSREDYDVQLCEYTLPQLNAQCVIMAKIFARTERMPKLEKFQFKVFSIIFSSFQNVLFLDADAFPIHNPDTLFDVDPFDYHGLVTWPDLWYPTTSPRFYRIAGVDLPPMGVRKSSESGIILYDKARHAESLLLAAYYNFYGPDHYYPLLSQNAHGQGDKETFLHAAMALGKPFYDVKAEVGFLGRWVNGKFETAGMKQADPREEYALRLQRFDSQRHSKRAAGEGNGKEAPQVAAVAGTVARPLFIHHNLVKIDMHNMGTENEGLLEVLRRPNEEGKPWPLWGPDGKLNAATGYDVELAMWETMLNFGCSSSSMPWCEQLAAYVQEAFHSEAA